MFFRKLYHIDYLPSQLVWDGVKSLCHVVVRMFGDVEHKFKSVELTYHVVAQRFSWVLGTFVGCHLILFMPQVNMCFQ